MFTTLQTLEDLTQTIQQTQGYTFIYKHSATCPTAILAKQQLEKGVENYPDTIIIYIHVWDQRALSNQVAEYFSVTHESPQLIVFKNGVMKEVKNHHSITQQYLGHILGNGWNKAETK